MPVWASPQGIAEKHQKAWLKVVCCNLPDVGLQVYAIRLSSRPDKLAHRANVLTRCALYHAGCGASALSGLRVSASENNRDFPC
ncbi:hypothetical protein E0V34_19845, partial [Escherichia coli]|nr:hypothetical protein [Escherichia coli]